MPLGVGNGTEISSIQEKTDNHFQLLLIWENLGGSSGISEVACMTAILIQYCQS